MVYSCGKLVNTRVGLSLEINPALGSMLLIARAHLFSQEVLYEMKPVAMHCEGSRTVLFMASCQKFVACALGIESQ